MYDIYITLFFKKNLDFKQKFLPYTCFSQFVLRLTSNNSSLLLKIFRIDARAVPPPQIFGGPLVLCLTSNSGTSQNIGGTDAWTVPDLKFWGTFPPVPP